jgi:hypothetical protein
MLTANIGIYEVTINTIYATFFIYCQLHTQQDAEHSYEKRLGYILHILLREIIRDITIRWFIISLQESLLKVASGRVRDPKFG